MLHIAENNKKKMFEVFSFYKAQWTMSPPENSLSTLHPVRRLA